MRSGSTRRASRVLQITQSAVSQQLKQFEEAVGEKLFIRDRCGLIPTSRAVEIYNKIDRYFEALGHIEREIFGSFTVARNSLTIAAPHIVCLSLLPRLVGKLERSDLLAGVLRPGSELRLGCAARPDRGGRCGLIASTTR
ncbi:LysR family transcriptional regulator [Agrobacterium leguminum]|uniref:LysR family transcriptional regulator n=1 Tax=Agrobacterium leguminum TaxID=2792015 RepID=UPI003C70C377